LTFVLRDRPVKLLAPAAAGTRLRRTFTFFLSPNEDSENKTAMQMLESGEGEAVLSEARTYLKHGS